MTDPATLVPIVTDDTPSQAAWYFGADTLFGHYRKVLLAGCRESVRATATESAVKLTEARIDDLAHTHAAYLDFLATHLDGRRGWMAHYMAEGGLK